VAIVAVLILGFVVEPVLLGVAGDIGRFGPTVGAPNGVIGISFGDETPLEPAVAVLVLAGWVAVLFAAAAALLERRDLV